MTSLKQLIDHPTKHVDMSITIIFSDKYLHRVWIYASQLDYYNCYVSKLLFVLFILWLKLQATFLSIRSNPPLKIHLKGDMTEGVRKNVIHSDKASFHHASMLFINTLLCHCLSHFADSIGNATLSLSPRLKETPTEENGDMSYS